MERANESKNQIAQVLTEEEAAEQLRVCTKTLRNLRDKEQIPFKRIGSRVLYIHDELIAWIRAGGTAQFKINPQDQGGK